jgi:hypothetical protein
MACFDGGSYPLRLTCPTLASSDLDIVVGDCLFVVFQGEDIDEDEQEQLAIAGVSTKMPRRSAADRGAGFGGTLLSGGHGPAPPAASSNSKPTSGSTSSTLKSASPESGVAVDGHRAATGRSMAAIGADIEAGVNVTAAEMEAFFQSTTGDDPVEAGSNACGQCSTCSGALRLANTCASRS